MKKLPKGIQTFSKIRENNYIYIDKTEDIYNLINNGEIYFLSRPRRFGKSLLISTMEELFKGNKELFKGLFIYDKWNWEEKYPVIRLDLSNTEHDDPQALKDSLYDLINIFAKRFKITLKSKTLNLRFKELIEEIYKKDGKIAILIDEYDKPIISHLDDIDLAQKNRDVLRSFYSILKANDEYLRFLFITGVTKFSKISIFSDLNHLDDITIHPKYTTICGYTQRDIEDNFDEYILKIMNNGVVSKEKVLKRIKDCYNGYSWDGKNLVYNPTSILKLFDTKIFANYWADTGTPKLLKDLIKNTNIDLEVLAKKKSEFKGSFPNFELDDMDFATILLQTGYLTIKQTIENPLKTPIYITGIPNSEVESSFYIYLLNVLTSIKTKNIIPLTKNILNAIYMKDDEKIQKSFETLFSKIPNMLWGNIKRLFEDFLKAILFIAIALMGFDVESEIMSIKGRLDLILRQNDLFLIMEFKYSEDENISFDELLKIAGNQIIEKGYYKPYQNRNVVILTIAFKGRDLKCKFKSLNQALKEYET
ncbi:MAG: ATP-binding protein [Methanobrevibacter sp.]|jgi:hypothetical protein|nr:ATP-binding protein [Candidatus Methanoflexus mossambicus]